MDNTFRWKSWELSVFLQYVNQQGINPIAQIYQQQTPGSKGPLIEIEYSGGNAAVLA